MIAIETVHSHNLILSIYLFIFSLGIFYSINVIVDAVDYWNKLLPNIDVDFTFVSVVFVLNLVFTIILIIMKSKLILSNGLYIGFAGQSIALLLIPSTKLFTFSEYDSYKLLILIICLIGSSCSLSSYCAFPLVFQVCGFCM